MAVQHAQLRKEESYHDLDLILPAFPVVAPVVVRLAMMKAGANTAVIVLLFVIGSGVRVLLDGRFQCDAPCEIQVPVGDGLVHDVRTTRPTDTDAVIHWQPTSVAAPLPTLPRWFPPTHRDPASREATRAWSLMLSTTVSGIEGTPTSDGARVKLPRLSRSFCTEISPAAPPRKISIPSIHRATRRQPKCQ